MNKNTIAFLKGVAMAACGALAASVVNDAYRKYQARKQAAK
ncbi:MULTISPECIES: hypothetical protein [Pseudoalteromonas]|uniref:Lipoprotein n=1 Tax=Pseudoalteromonas maricaloris TaxID=184924 RepID=A0ABZ0M550_9GAMM|nr:MULTISPECIES: hypothetical protein [Pseudoalteromonas]WOX26907.1 hypothetical protein R5H13_09510 [Pseudoalteromonas maricaloris]WOX31391.1 hypothetical protein R5H13_20850 [Pseudoalteromonas maricaloris]